MQGSGISQYILMKQEKGSTFNTPPWIRTSRCPTRGPNLEPSTKNRWSDGLGNPLDNSLPRCQLRRIGKLIASLPRHPIVAEFNNTMHRYTTTQPSGVVECCFWMDTLCIPVNNQELRNKGIEKMRNVYSSATNVLVMNTELMQSSCERSYTEIFTRITYSSWLRRLWTLQEALLNRNLLFQFSERAVYVDVLSKLYQARKRDTEENPWDLVAWECARYDFSILNKNLSWTDSELINSIWDAFKYRTTSRSGDEPLCMAILLDLNIKKLQEAADTERLKTFWSLHTHGVPASIIFIPVKKLDEPYGWAPADLLDLKVMGGDMKSHGTVTPRGLCVSYPGFILSELERHPDSVISCKVDGTIFFIRQNLRHGSPAWKGLDLHKRKRLAVILLIVDGSAKKDSYGHVIKGTEEKEVSGIEAGLGVLVEGRGGLHEQERHVKFLRVVSVIREGSFLDVHPNTPWSDGDIEEKKGTPVAGTFLPYGQRWCVG